MASFENYNLPYNYTTAVTLTKTLSILVSVNFLTCGWTPNSCFFPRLKIFSGLLLQIVVPHSAKENEIASKNQFEHFVPNTLYLKIKHESACVLIYMYHKHRHP